MNALERVRTVLGRGVPDRVPRALYDVAIGTYNESTLELFQERMGRHPRDCFDHDVRAVDLPRREMDRAWCEQIRGAFSPDQVCDLMAPWRPTRADPDTVKGQIDAVHASGHAAIAIGWASDFETPFDLRGREQFFIDLALREEWLEPFLDAVADAASEDGRLAAAAGCDIFGIGDDLGSQRGLLISPALWRELFKPRLRRIIDTVKQANPDTAFFLHTDGLVTELIPDFIEVGVDILNPIQPEVMDPAEVKLAHGSDMIFFGAISVQHTLPLGTPQDVWNEVKLRMETIGAGGGYVMTPSHLINADIPWENIVAFFEAADAYGGYG